MLSASKQCSTAKMLTIPENVLKLNLNVESSKSGKYFDMWRNKHVIK
jgi:hypothetical protein